MQARLGSTRFPNKVLRAVAGAPLIKPCWSVWPLQRVDLIILATPEVAGNEPLADYVRKLGYEVYQGSENDVLDRYYRAASLVQTWRGDPDYRRLPARRPELVDALLADFARGGADYVSNTLVPTFSDGLDVEVFGYHRRWRGPGARRRRSSRERHALPKGFRQV